MGKKTNLFVGIGLIIYSIVEYTDQRMDEFILYAVLGVAFMITWFSARPGLDAQTKKILVILSWVLIILSAFWFFYLVRTDMFRS